MSDTRRSFLQSTVLGAGLSAGVSRATAQEIEVPKMKFGPAEIGRLVLGTNPFYGYSHFNSNLDYAMRQWYTPDRICEVMRRCTEFGIDAFNYVNIGRSSVDLRKFHEEGGKTHLVAQIIGDPAPTWKAFKPLGMYNQGEQVDKAFQSGHMNTVEEWCKQTRDLGCLVGVGTHTPEVIAYVEEKGWDVDFYAGCVYNRTRTAEQWKRTLNGNIQEIPQETYLQGDPSRMYEVMRATKKPCFAFKVLAAGRIRDNGVEQAFRTAFASIKPTDGVIVGMWPYRKDEVRENAEIVARILRSHST